MKKLMLDLDALVVETFETHRVEGAGTVAAHAQIVQPANTHPNCSEIDACPSALADCNYTVSCKGACDSLDACGSSLSECFNTGCGGCSGPICIG
jgi:hypothetical protein